MRRTVLLSHLRFDPMRLVAVAACAFSASASAGEPAPLAPNPLLDDTRALRDDAAASGSASATMLAQESGTIDEAILLPPIPPNGENGERKWARDYFSIAAGIVSVPSYSGSDERNILPGFYLRGRVSGFAFSTRGTNLQLDLVRQRRGEKTDVKFGPIINLRSDRTGRIKDPQVEALGEKKLAIEAGVMAGVTHTGLVTSGYDQLGFRVVALKDISGRHGSWAISPTIDYGTPLSKRAYVGVSASVNLYGKGFGGYYYDIDPAGSAASGLPVYDRAGRKATVGKYTLGMAGAYALSGDLRKGFVLIGGAQYGRMLGRFGNSPIVSIAGSRNQWLAGGGVAYQF